MNYIYKVPGTFTWNVGSVFHVDEKHEMQVPDDWDKNFETYEYYFSFSDDRDI